MVVLKAGKNCLKVILCLLVLGAGCVAQEYMRFMPGSHGEVTACLVAGPFADTVPELESSDYSEISAGNNVTEKHSQKWEAFTSSSGVINLAKFIRGESAAKYFYLFTSVFSGKEQDGVILVSSNTPAVLRDDKNIITAKFDRRNARHVAYTKHNYFTGRNKFLVRVELGKGNPNCAIVVGSSGKDSKLILDDYVIEIPGAVLNDQLRNSLLQQTLQVEAKPALLGKSDDFYFAFKFLPGAPVPAGSVGAVLKLFDEKNRVIAAEVFGESIPLSSITKGVYRKILLSRDKSYKDLTLRLAIKSDGRDFGYVDKKYLSEDSLLEVIKNKKTAIEDYEAITGRDFSLSRLGVVELEELSKSLIGNPAASYTNVEKFVENSGRIDLLNESYASGKDPMLSQKGFINGAYVSRLDGSVQPYRLYIPTSFSDADFQKGIPLVVVYHGYVPSYTRVSWRTISDREMFAFEKAGVAALFTFGRSNTDFLNVGEVDTFEALRDVQKKYHIDRKRIYLFGYSMGGSGVWTTLTHYPDVFAAAAVWSGRTDYYFWHNLKRQDLPPFMRMLINTDNPFDLAENLSLTPLFVEHPQDDTLVKPGHTERMKKRLEAYLRSAPLKINMPEKGSHWYYSKRLQDPEVYKNMLQYSLDEKPASINIVTYTPKYGINRWLSVDVIQKWTELASLGAEVNSENKEIVINMAANVAAFSVNKKYIAQAYGWDEGSVRVRLSGKNPDTANFSLSSQSAGMLSYVNKRSKTLVGAPLLKKKNICGPVKEVFCSPFMVVLGTCGKNDENNINLQMLETFRKEWQSFAKGDLYVKNDQDVTDNDVSSFNLICIGGALSNSFVKKVAENIPYKFMADSYDVAGNQVRRGKKPLGFIGCFPNPKQTDKLLVIMDGIFYGEFLPINHKWDLIPDYLVFRSEKWKRSTNYAELAGFFDSSWRFDTSLVFKQIEKK